MSAEDEVSGPPTSRAQDLRFWLRFSDHDVELSRGEVILGRSPGCSILIDDPLVSRQHARFSVGDDEVTLRDLGSVNGILVNGERIDGVARLRNGDRIAIGKHAIEFYAVAPHVVPSRGDRNRTLTQTLTNLKTQQAIEVDEPTRQGNALELLGAVVEKVLAMGRGAEAENILKNTLNTVLERAREGEDIGEGMAQKAVVNAVRLGAALGKAQWVDYAFELYTLRASPLPVEVVDSLYQVLRKIPNVNYAGYQAYLKVLQAKAKELGPAEGFLIRRIEGLNELVKG